MFNETEWNDNIHAFPKTPEAERRQAAREDEEGRWSMPACILLIGTVALFLWALIGWGIKTFS